MKRRTLKGLNFLLAIVLSLSLLAGCASSGTSSSGTASSETQTPSGSVSGGDGTSSGPLFDSPVNFSMFTASHPSWPFQEDWYVVDLLKEMTNVTFDVTAVDTAGFTEKLNLIMAGGDLPDLMYVLGNKPVQQYGPQGAFINVLDHIDKMPNFKAWYEENNAYALNYLSSDGALYMLPQHGVEETNRRIWLYREDVFAEHNLKMPANQEEFYDVLVQLKKAYPNSYPLAFRSFPADMNQLNMLAPSWGTSFISSENSTWFGYDYDSEEWEFGPTSDEFREMVAFYHKLYVEGLLLPNFLTIDTKGWQDVIANSDSFITLDYLSRIDFFNVSMRESQPDFTMSYMAPPAFGENGVAKLAHSSKFLAGFTISSQTKKLDEVLKYMDWMYSDEAYELLSWGRPDDLYTEQAGGTREWNDFATAAEMKQGTGFETYGFYARYNFEAERSIFSNECYDASVEASKHDLPIAPVLSYTEAERAIVDTVGTNVTTYVSEQLSKFLLGERSMDEWDAYVAGAEALGLAQLKEVHESSYARVLEAQKD